MGKSRDHFSAGKPHPFDISGRPDLVHEGRLTVPLEVLEPTLQQRVAPRKRQPQLVDGAHQAR